ncbi:hypothetical protein L1887_22352 [Cichorium endivia]|nr:hypothetical protein L1887_22352 [Cichorium endivia]
MKSLKYNRFKPILFIASLSRRFQKLGIQLHFVLNNRKSQLAKLCWIMAGGNFVQRVMSYLVNEILVDSLANSRAFQRFAVKTSKSMEEISSIAAKKRQELAEQVKEMSRNFESKNRLD